VNEYQVSKFILKLTVRTKYEDYTDCGRIGQGFQI